MEILRFRVHTLSRAAVIFLLAVGVPARAEATIAPASVLDGPSSSILEVDGAALAPDGTGGVVYRKLVDGEPHVFVSRFLGGTWQAPIQVDVGQTGPASFPAIAAGNGGELLVVWVQPWMWISASPGAQATLHYALMSAVLQPGAQSFGQIERIEDVGDGTAVYPSLAMAPNGDAYVAYRTVVNPLAPGTNLPIQPLHGGDELLDVRVSRFNGLSWSSVGLMNGLPGQVTMRRPTASNAPVVGVDSAGQALVVWQEPEISGVARIWARRIFGTVKGNVLAVSPTTIDNRPVTVDADAPALAFNEDGEAVVAFRLEGGAGSPLGSPHVLLNTLAMPVSEEVSSFTGAVPLDGAGTLGPPSVAVDANGEYRLAYTGGGAAHLISGKSATNGSPASLGPAAGEAALTTVDPEGGGVTAWPAVDPAGRPVIEAHQDFPGGAWQMAYLTAPLSGPVSDLAVGQSGLGDALIAFRQGPPEGSQVVAALAQAPPGRFEIHAPSGWVHGQNAAVEWEAAPNAVGAIAYAVLVDGRVAVHGLGGLSYKLSLSGLGNGVRHVKVLATDALGQQTMSSAADLRVATNPPLVKVRRLSRGRVEVTVSDGDGPGVKVADTLVDFGDGATVRRQDRAIHAYRRSGRYTIVVHATDKVGNSRDAHVLVEVR
jgi:hypothetical protein